MLCQRDIFQIRNRLILINLNLNLSSTRFVINFPPSIGCGAGNETILLSQNAVCCVAQILEGQPKKYRRSNQRYSHVFSTGFWWASEEKSEEESGVGPARKKSQPLMTSWSMPYQTAEELLFSQYRTISRWHFLLFLRALHSKFPVPHPLYHILLFLKIFIEFLFEHTTLYVSTHPKVQKFISLPILCVRLPFLFIGD